MVMGAEGYHNKGCVVVLLRHVDTARHPAILADLAKGTGIGSRQRDNLIDRSY